MTQQRPKKAQEDGRATRTERRRRQRNARGKKARAARARQASASTTTGVQRSREALTNVDGVLVAPERVRPSYHPVFRATIELVEGGKPPTLVNIAKELGCSKQAVSQLFQRHPDLWAWIDRLVQAANQHFVGSIVRRHSMLAIQGSVDSAELVLKFHGGAYGARAKDDGEPGQAFSAHQTVFNFLVPAPPIPTAVLEEAKQPLPPPMTWPAIPANVPIVSSR